MTPAARVAAAIEILDRVQSGEPAEKVLTGWARSNRYAGSGDRAAIRDHVFDVLRCARSYAWLGGSDDGRGLMIGALRAKGHDLEPIFTGGQYAPEALSDAEMAANDAPMPAAVALDCQDWMLPRLQADLGEHCEPFLEAMKTRAPVFLRVNLARIDRESAISALAEEGIECRAHALSPSALEVVENPRRVGNSAAFRDGLIELQDTASQALADILPIESGQRVLDFCAGGGGKTLAMAGRCDAKYHAYDVDEARMRDLPARAARAGVDVVCLTKDDLVAGGQYDLVLCDAPCTGVGAWRRSPQAKWLLQEDRLSELLEVQAGILREAAGYVAPQGVLAYATCSVLGDENEKQIQAFLGDCPEWSLIKDRLFLPMEGGDGFYIALLTRV